MRTSTKARGAPPAQYNPHQASKQLWLWLLLVFSTMRDVLSYSIQYFAVTEQMGLHRHIPTVTIK
eukprot:scaffold83726_cov29-Tisochrysis_lutea.AAC.8